MPESAFVHEVTTESVADRVTSEIRRAILGGRLRPGQEFSLRTIAAQLGVSFIPVREALRSLEAEGLLMTRRGRSATVAPLDGDELRGICGLRQRVEPELAARSGSAVDEAHLDLLRPRLERCTDRALSPDARYDEYHAIYFDLLRTSATDWEMRVTQMLARAIERYVRAGRGEIDHSSQVPTELIVALRELIAAAGTNDPEKIRATASDLVDLGARIAGESLARVRQA
ncbi:GntR family transcriptional regulator [Pseudonocardia eucalypti]|uniref:GntR family transcriptional regulator n=1 Tax=Pseudonocardia eucalypti TaxID=648755 RepID=A0ABP9PTV6_9PSEU